MILGKQIKVYTDHKNSTYKTFNAERVMRWRLILDEYNLELTYTYKALKILLANIVDTNNTVKLFKSSLTE